MEKLNFLTAGVPTLAGNYERAGDTLRELNLDGMEIEFVHGTRMSDVTKRTVQNIKRNLIYTAHGPYYINLNAKEKEKVDASINRILDTARITKELNGYSIVYHAGFYLGQESKVVSDKILRCHREIIETLEKENNDIWIRPETTGKRSQWGDLDEIVSLCKNFKQVLPCVDFAHLHARSNGEYNTYDDFCRIFEKIGNELGDYALKNFHAHIAGINYTEKGERNHLILEESDMNYKDLLKSFKNMGVFGVIICESPNIEIDCKILKEYYLSL